MTESRFFGELNYSSVNEDWRTEARALQLRDGDRVLCITGSGARALDLLAVANVRVVALDASPAQNHLLRLKMRAIETLPFADYTRFLGLNRADGSWRLAILDKPALPHDSQAFWKRRWRDVSAGVLYRGRFERHFSRISRLARLLRGPAIRQLLSFNDLEAQRHFLRTIWDTPWWRAVYWIATHPSVSRLVFGDPAYYQHIQMSPGPYLFNRMLEGLQQYLAHDSFMVTLVLSGRLSPHDLPPHLQKEGFDRIRLRLARIEVVDANVGDWLDQERRSFDRYSLPGELRWGRERDLERQLAREGRDIAYEFLIAKVMR